MSKNKELAILPPGLPTPQLESYVVNFNRMEEVHSRLKLAFQALQGYALTILREAHGNSTRGNPKLRNSPHHAENWESYVKTKFGFSDDTATRYMKIWDGIRPRLAKLDEADQKSFLGLLTKPIGTFTPAQLERLRELTHKITDADSQMAFLRECGYIKQRQSDLLNRGSGPSGGGGESGPISTVDDQVKVQMELFGQFSLSLEKTHKVGNQDVLLIASWPKPRLKDALAVAKRNVQLLVKILGKKK